MKVHVRVVYDRLHRLLFGLSSVELIFNGFYYPKPQAITNRIQTVMRTIVPILGIGRMLVEVVRAYGVVLGFFRAEIIGLATMRGHTVSFIGRQKIR